MDIFIFERILLILSLRREGTSAPTRHDEFSDFGVARPTYITDLFTAPTDLVSFFRDFFIKINASPEHQPHENERSVPAHKYVKEGSESSRQREKAEQVRCHMTCAMRHKRRRAMEKNQGRDA